MGAAYDYYDYPSYWEDREYEHKSEVIALKKLFSKIARKEKLIEIGAGFGRLAPVYLPKVGKAYLVDPSSKLLQLAASNLSPSFSNFTTVLGEIQNLPPQINMGDFDIALIVRVLHHIEDPKIVTEAVAKILQPGGFFILEFANKINFKARIRAAIQADFDFTKNLEPADLRTPYSQNQANIHFLNHHPQRVIGLLEESGFKIQEILSASNLRFLAFKRLLPLSLLLSLEKMTQKPLAKFFFGPSIFILAKKI